MEKLLNQLNDFDLLVVLWWVRFKYARHQIRKYLPKLRPPRPVILVSYLYIVYTVVATIIMIASRNLMVGVVLFGLFVVPLYAMIAYTRRLAKRYHMIGQNMQRSMNYARLYTDRSG